MRRLALLTALLALLLSACGGGDEKKQAAPAKTVTASQGLRVVGKEYSFSPENVVVNGAGRLKITLDNEGSLAHNLKVEKDGEEIGGTPTFAGGDSQSGTVKLAPGDYTFVCTVGNHEDLGMTGKLTVKR